MNVSVLMSTRNRSATLSRAIESVLCQQGVRVELVIVDDHSSDETPDILARWRDDQRVICIHNAENLGLSASLNRAARRAGAGFLARIDDDDYWTDDKKLKRQLAWMDAHPDGVLVGTAYIDEQGRVSTNPLGDAEIRKQMLFRCAFCHSSTLIRRTAFETASGYDEALPYAEDWDLWARLGMQGVLGNLARVTLIKEPGENNLSQRYFQRQLQMAQNLAERYAGAYPGARRAVMLHRFSRVFFRVVPLNNVIHRGMSKLFRWVFQLGSSDSSGKT